MTQKSYCTGWRAAPADVNNCCHQHDHDYGVNGTVTRAEADRKLRLCITGNGRPVLAWLAWAVVRCAGWYFYKPKDLPKTADQ